MLKQQIKTALEAFHHAFTFCDARMFTFGHCY